MLFNHIMARKSQSRDKRAWSSALLWLHVNLYERATLTINSLSHQLVSPECSRIRRQTNNATKGQDSRPGDISLLCSVSDLLSHTGKDTSALFIFTSLCTSCLPVL